MSATLPDPDVVAAALVATLGQLVGTLRCGRSEPVGSTTVVVTGVPVPTLNLVLATEDRTPVPDLEAGLQRLRATGLPHGLQARPACRDAGARIAARHGLTDIGEVPVMARAGAVRVASPQDLTVRRMRSDDAPLHAQLAGNAFGAPPGVFAALIAPGLLARPGTRGYLGERDGEPVVTGLAMATGDAVGVFNVATAPEHRRQGYAAAVTARAVNDGLSAGASWSWLQPTSAGYPLYERLGFRTLERWSCWVSD